MADHTDESKPKVEGEVINIVVKDQSGNEVHFKIKTTTKLEKVRAPGVLDSPTARRLRLEAYGMSRAARQCCCMSPAARQCCCTSPAACQCCCMSV